MLTVKFRETRISLIHYQFFIPLIGYFLPQLCFFDFRHHAGFNKSFGDKTGKTLSSRFQSLVNYFPRPIQIFFVDLRHQVVPLSSAFFAGSTGPNGIENSK